MSAAGSWCVGSATARGEIMFFFWAGGAASASASVQVATSPAAQAWERVAPSVEMRGRSRHHSDAIWVPGREKGGGGVGGNRVGGWVQGGEGSGKGRDEAVLRRAGLGQA